MPGYGRPILSLIHIYALGHDKLEVAVLVLRDSQIGHIAHRRVELGQVALSLIHIYQQAVVLGHNGVQQLAALNEQTARRAAHDAARDHGFDAKEKSGAPIQIYQLDQLTNKEFSDVYKRQA